MGFQFATCERGRALEFLRQLYPSATITDTPESAARFLDLVERDIVRIPDPSMHGPRVTIYPSANWDESKHAEYVSIMQEFHDQANK